MPTHGTPITNKKKHSTYIPITGTHSPTLKTRHANPDVLTNLSDGTVSKVGVLAENDGN